MIPALLTRIEIGPIRDRIEAARPSHPERSVTSQAKLAAWPPIAIAVPCAALSSISATMIRAPALAIVWAIASPIPEPAPVISANRPSSGPVMVYPCTIDASCAGLTRASTSFLRFPRTAGDEPGHDDGNYIAAMRAARRFASGVAGSTAGVGWTFLVERGNVQSHSSAPI